MFFFITLRVLISTFNSWNRKIPLEIDDNAIIQKEVLCISLSLEDNCTTTLQETNNSFAFRSLFEIVEYLLSFLKSLFIFSK